MRIESCYLLPGPNDIDRTTIRARLDQAHEEPHDTKLCVGFASRRAHGQARPDEDHGREPDSGRDLLDCNAMGDLADGVTRVENNVSEAFPYFSWLISCLPCRRHRKQNIVVCSFEVESLLESGDLVHSVSV
jgi:hypothetical protein